MKIRSKLLDIRWNIFLENDKNWLHVFANIVFMLIFKVSIVRPFLRAFCWFALIEKVNVSSEWCQYWWSIKAENPNLFLDHLFIVSIIYSKIGALKETEWSFFSWKILPSTCKNVIPYFLIWMRKSVIRLKIISGLQNYREKGSFLLPLLYFSQRSQWQIII